MNSLLHPRSEALVSAVTTTTLREAEESSSQEDGVDITLQGLCDVNTDWSFQMSLESLSCENNTNLDGLSIPAHLYQAFQEDGFVVFPNVLSESDVDILRQHLEDVLRGHYDRGPAPDKMPAVQSETTSSRSTAGTTTKKKQKHGNKNNANSKNNSNNAKVLQVINVHKADSAFRKLACNETLGHVVAQLAGWTHLQGNYANDDDNNNAIVGTRLAQDQVWAKPPGAPPLTFHRDSPYFMFEPNDVVTVWVALDDMHESIGPLEYVRASHLWGDGRVGSANQFFQSDYRTLLKSAAVKEGIRELHVVNMAGLSRGGISIHNGRTWHGSGRNNSTSQPRRGLGLHFVPAHVKFTSQAAKSRLWKSYVSGTTDPTLVELSTADFPITWRASG